MRSQAVAYRCADRVCVIDCDSQASTTSMCGQIPDLDVDEDDDTLCPFFRHGGLPPSIMHLAGHRGQTGRQSSANVP